MMPYIPTPSLSLKPLPSFALLKASQEKPPFTLMIFTQVPMVLLKAQVHHPRHPNQYPFLPLTSQE